MIKIKLPCPRIPDVVERMGDIETGSIVKTKDGKRYLICNQGIVDLNTFDITLPKNDGGWGWDTSFGKITADYGVFKLSKNNKKINDQM